MTNKTVRMLRCVSLVSCVALSACATDEPIEHATSTPPVSSDMESLSGDMTSSVLDMAPSDRSDMKPSEGDMSGPGQAITPRMPRWVVRDKTRQEAIDIALAPYPVSQSYDSANPYISELNVVQPTCVNIDGTRQKPLRYSMIYDLTTGTMQPCFKSDWKPPAFLDRACSIPISLYAATTPQLYQGQVVASWGQGKAINSLDVYYTQTSEGMCKGVDVVPLATPNYFYWEVRPVPSDIQNLLASGAPYTLTWE